MLPALYHAHHSRYQEDLPFWLNLAARTGDPLLELGCGTGRVLVPLAQAGHRTVGIDYDPGMLKFLQANMGRQLKPEPLLLVADIRKFNLAVQFPLIILPCNTFSTLREPERLACLEYIRKHLKHGGMFAASIPNPELIKNLPARSKNQLEDEFIHPRTGNPVQVSSAWKRLKNTFVVTWIYDHLLPDGKVERFTVRTSHQMSTIGAYLEEIRRVGMKVSGIYGDYDCTDYRQDSPYLIFLLSV